MDLEKGKQIFFKYYGNHFSIDRECPKEFKNVRYQRKLSNSGLKK